MFRRQLMTSLEQWASNPNRKPLVLRGARQTGKTTLVNAFGQTFDCFIQLNLEKPEHKRIFESDLSFQELLSAIFYYSGNILSDKRTLIFIDEIQNSASAVASLRYFYEEAPEIHLIAAGSLLESLLHKHISFPVGRVEYMYLRPCSFTEYLNALKEDLSFIILEKNKIPPYAHNKLTDHFNRYALIGGMPEVISKYAETRDILAINPVYGNLLTGFNDDVEKYGRNANMVQHIRHILKTGFFYACQRIKFEKFGSSDYRSREMGEAFRTLEKALLIELVYPITKSSLPVIPDIKKSPRLFWLDTGLVNFMAGIQKEIFGANDITSTWRGLVAEHIAAQELLALDKSLLARRSFWVREAKNSNAEIDFIYSWNGLLIPVEIKSGEGSRLLSLHLFMDTAPHDYAVRIWSSPFSKDIIYTRKGKKILLINIPFYLIHKLPDILDRI